MVVAGLTTKVGDWRHRDGFVGEMMYPNGEWTFPDCEAGCLYCDVCLGCAKRYPWAESPYCKQAPTGYHWPIEVDRDDGD